MIANQFRPGDIVRFHGGSVDWEVKFVGGAGADGGECSYVLESGMSGRRATASQREIRPWKPGER